jgi:hypothetical protein
VVESRCFVMTNRLPPLVDENVSKLMDVVDEVAWKEARSLRSCRLSGKEF